MKRRVQRRALAALVLAACGGGGGGASEAAPSAPAGPQLELPSVALTLSLPEGELELARGASGVEPLASGGWRMTGDGAAFVVVRRDGHVAGLAVMQLPPLEGPCADLLGAASHAWMPGAPMQTRTILGTLVRETEPHDSQIPYLDPRIPGMGPHAFRGAALERGGRCVGLSFQYQVADEATFGRAWEPIAASLRAMEPSAPAQSR